MGRRRVRCEQKLGDRRVLQPSTNIASLNGNIFAHWATALSYTSLLNNSRIFIMALSAGARGKRQRPKLHRGACKNTNQISGVCAGATFLRRCACCNRQASSFSDSVSNADDPGFVNMDGAIVRSEGISARTVLGSIAAIDIWRDGHTCRGYFRHTLPTHYRVTLFRTACCCAAAFWFL